MTLAPGGFVDDAHRYELDSRIATGGMGEVWRARDVSLHRPVAVKVLKAEYADDATFRTRFETEARHAASLHHPGIAGVFDYGEAEAIDGSGKPRPYLVMELVEGQPLSDLLRPSSPMDAGVARDLMAQAADALGAAHTRGIVHRDVKPANLIVTPDRRVKVTDFGIARAAEGMALTETGQVLGTPAYISPEQASGDKASAASDVYSLAVVAFECLTGRKPFLADTPVATAVAHLRNPVPELPDSVPADLAAVVRRALAKVPSERPADGLAFAAALRSGEVPAVPPTAVPPTAVPPTTVPPTTVLPTAGAAGAAAAPAPTITLPAQGGGRTSAAPPPRRRTGVPWALLLGIVAVLLAIGLAFALANGDDPEPRGTDPETPSETPTPTPTSTPTPTPTGPKSSPVTPARDTVEVDPAAYVGRDHKDVEKDLRDLGLKPEKNELENPGDQPEGVVTDVSPAGTVELGETVEVSFWGKPPKEGPGALGDGPGGGPGGGDEGSNGEGNQG